MSSATLSLLEVPSLTGEFHISGEDYISIYELVEKIAKKLGLDVDDCIEVSEDRIGKDQAYLLNSQKLKSMTGWSTNYSLDRGLDETIDWVMQNLDFLREEPDTYIHKR